MMHVLCRRPPVFASGLSLATAFAVYWQLCAARDGDRGVSCAAAGPEGAGVQRRRRRDAVPRWLLHRDWPQQTATAGVRRCAGGGGQVCGVARSPPSLVLCSCLPLLRVTVTPSFVLYAGVASPPPPSCHVAAPSLLLVVCGLLLLPSASCCVVAIMPCDLPPPSSCCACLQPMFSNLHVKDLGAYRLVLSKYPVARQHVSCSPLQCCTLSHA
jgi:hypothetical protein